MTPRAATRPWARAMSRGRRRRHPAVPPIKTAPNDLHPGSDPLTPQEADQTVQERFRTTFRALTVRNYRLFASGQLVSLLGNWMQVTAQDWLVLKLSHNSPSALGLVTALQFTPVLLRSEEHTSELQSLRHLVCR